MYSEPDGYLEHDGNIYALTPLFALAYKRIPQPVTLEKLIWCLSPVDPERLTKADVNFPILVAWVKYENSDRLLLVDGNHRVHKAVQAGIATLPAIYIKKSELNRCRIPTSRDNFPHRRSRLT